MLDLSLNFDAGGRFDPPQRVGLASLTNAMLAKGLPGPGRSSDRRRFRHAWVRSAAAAPATIVPRSRCARSAASRRNSRPPSRWSNAFSPSRLFPSRSSRARRSAYRSRCAKRRPNPTMIARRAFGSSLYRDHPYGWYATPESIAAIGRDDLVAFYRANYAASRAVVAMIGDVLARPRPRRSRRGSPHGFRRARRAPAAARAWLRSRAASGGSRIRPPRATS